MKSGLLLLLFSLFSYDSTQQGDSLGTPISQIFTKPVKSTNTDSRNPSQEVGIDLPPTGGGGGTGSGTDSGSGYCECVPYYLCNNNNTVTYESGTIDIAIGKTPCHYLSVCCNPPDVVEQPITPPPDITKPTGCGVRNHGGVDIRIEVDEDELQESQYGEFPWMVAVLREEAVEGSSQKLLTYQCGASLIHPQAVLTSAHCVSGKDKQYKIRAGEWDTQTEKELFAHQDRDVKTIIIHPEYYSRALFNDVAVLILSSALEIQEHVDTVCLPKQGEVVENTRCFTSGWGKDVFGKEGKYQVILKKIDLPIVSRDTCQERLRTTRLGKHFKLHESFICAGGEEGKDTCKGDGGSPLVCPIAGHPGRYFQAGIVAWGIGCGENQIPGVYANVAMFSKWIDDQIAVNQLNKSTYTY